MSQSARFDLKQLFTRLSRGEQLIAVASLVLLVALFLDWLSFSCNGAFCGAAGAGASAFNGWGWLTFLALLSAVALLVSRRLLASTVKLPEFPVTDSVLYIGAGILEVVGCLLFWVEYHGSFGSFGSGVASYSYGLGFGWWLGIVAGAATVVGALLTERTSEAAAAERFSPPHAPVPPPVS